MLWGGEWTEQKNWEKTETRPQRAERKTPCMFLNRRDFSRANFDAYRSSRWSELLEHSGKSRVWRRITEWVARQQGQKKQLGSLSWHFRKAQSMNSNVRRKGGEACTVRKWERKAERCTHGLLVLLLNDQPFIDWPFRLWWLSPQPQVLQRVMKVFVDLLRFLGWFQVRKIFPDFLNELIQHLNCHLDTENAKGGGISPEIVMSTRRKSAFRIFGERRGFSWVGRFAKIHFVVNEGCKRSCT